MNDEKILDDILGLIGFGKKQAIGFICVCFVVFFYAGTHMSFLFTAYDSDYRCFVPTCDEESSPKYDAKWVRNAIPSDKHDLKKCEMFVKISTDDTNCSTAVFNTTETNRCSSYVFKEDEYYINREYNILCEENRWKLSLVGSIRVIGMFVGSPIFGSLSDKYGRKKLLLVNMTLCGIIGLLRIVSPTFELFCLMEFLNALLTSGTFYAGFILAAELVVPKYRVWTLTIFNIFFLFGQLLLSITAWISRDWRIITYVFYVPSVFSILLHWFIPESIRWYSSKGKLEQAMETLKKFSNKKTIPRSYLHFLQRNILQQEEKNKAISFAEMLKSLPLLLRLITCCVLWTLCLLVNYGLTIYSIELTTNAYLNVIILTITEIVANWIIQQFIGEFRRKTCLHCSNFLTVISCLICIFIEPKFTYSLIYCFGKFGATINYEVLVMVTLESFPTPLRHTTMATCSMVGRLGTMISPQMPLLEHIWEPLPMIVFTSAAIISGILSFFLPETLNVKLPDTIEEAENISKTQSQQDLELRNI